MAISIENGKFTHPMYFAPSLKGFPSELGLGIGVKKLECWGYQTEQNI